MNKAIAWVTFLAVGGFVAASSLFVVDQTEQALVLQLGKPVRVQEKPGLGFKIPFLQNVEYFDKRILNFDVETKEVIAADQKRLIVDAFVRYRIVDPLLFKQSVINETRTKEVLNPSLESSLREAVGGVPLSAIISSKRSVLMQQVRDLVNQRAQKTASGKGLGIEIIDVRLVRADLPQANSESVYRRMQTELERQTKQFRAQGAEDAQKIRSQADKERTIILAEARKTAEITRGEGDGIATKIFAQSFGQDKEFFDFYRSMQAYKKTISPNDTTMVMSPRSEFLQFME